MSAPYWALFLVGWVADAEGVDLVVVGRRGRGLSRTLLGSAAATLTTDARCPVLLAAPPDART